jgi:Phosphotransferase enzyme family
MFKASSPQKRGQLRPTTLRRQSHLPQNSHRFDKQSIQKMSNREIPLTGGRFTAGVVRVGDTVRRPVTSDRTIQQALLEHLEAKSFEATPRFLGIDEKGREILTFIAGEVPDDLGHFTDHQLSKAAQLLRRFHDATMDFPQVVAAGAEVMCHNDWSPNNTVFRKDIPFGVIDFDTVAPGARLWDLGYSAFTWLNLGDGEFTGAEQKRRISLFAEAYHEPAVTPVGIVRHALTRQDTLAEHAKRMGDEPLREWAASAAEWTKKHLA